MVRRKNAELADLAETAANEAERLLANAKRALRKAEDRRRASRRPTVSCDAVTGRRRGRLVRAVNDLTELLDATRKIVEQTRERLAGQIPDGATRQVSLHDPDARPISKGPARETCRVRPQGSSLVDNDDGIALDDDVQPGNPPMDLWLKPAVERVIGRTRRKASNEAHCYCGYGEAGASRMTSTISVSETSSFLARAYRQSPTSPRTPPEPSDDT